MKIKIKYHTDIEPLKYIGGEKSNWIDLRAAETVFIPEGEYRLISLGVSMELPEGYEAHVVPRSSTFKKMGHSSGEQHRNYRQFIQGRCGHLEVPGVLR